MTTDAFLPYRLPGTDAQPQTNTFAEGLILDVSTRGARFTIPSWDSGKHVFGPAPWPRPEAASTPPPRGARALILFLGPGIGTPWVLGWWA